LRDTPDIAESPGVDETFDVGDCGFPLGLRA
jgi:hypothetical protein